MVLFGLAVTFCLFQLLQDPLFCEALEEYRKATWGRFLTEVMIPVVQKLELVKSGNLFGT